MSEARFPQESDRSYNLKAVGVAAAFLAASLAGVFWAYLILKARSDVLVPKGVPIFVRELRTPETGIVIKTLFDIDTRFDDLRAKQEKELATWGYADREKKLVHMPIEEAMKRIAAESGR